jgi:hypothetical protein
MLIAVGMLCVGFAWLSHSLKWIDARHEWLKKDREPKSMLVFCCGGPIVFAPGCLWLLGEQGQGYVLCEPDEFDHVRRLFPEARVATLEPSLVSGSRVPDDPILSADFSSP